MGDTFTTTARTTNLPYYGTTRGGNPAGAGATEAAAATATTNLLAVSATAMGPWQIAVVVLLVLVLCLGVAVVHLYTLHMQYYYWKTTTFLTFSSYKKKEKDSSANHDDLEQGMSTRAAVPWGETTTTTKMDDDNDIQPNGLIHRGRKRRLSSWRRRKPTTMVLPAISTTDEKYRGDAPDILNQMLLALSTSQKDALVQQQRPNQFLHVRNNLTEYTDTAQAFADDHNVAYAELDLHESIGGGGFGMVFRATWRGTPVAVKVLSPSRTTLAEFVAEINVLHGLSHGNILLYMGACLDTNNRAIITEWAARGSLWDALRRPLARDTCYRPCNGRARCWPLSLYLGKPTHPLLLSFNTTTTTTTTRTIHVVTPIPPAGCWPWELVKRVARGTAQGMTYLHSGKPPVLHRDLKSANILLDDSYTPKICDFGLSRLKARDGSGMTYNCGTVQWMAPEVMAKKPYNEKVDVYSYAIVLWELLTRQCPFEGLSPSECVEGVLCGRARPEIPAWCPPSLCALICACWHQNPQERPSFREILRAFDELP